MKFRRFKKCRKYTEIYTKEKETKELQIDLDQVKVYITEHQMGMPIGETWVDIIVKSGYTYSMSLSSLINTITGKFGKNDEKGV